MVEMETSIGKNSRTPQACDRCRRSKTKCNGVRPRCRSCLKRKSICSWPKEPAPGGYYPIGYSVVNLESRVQNNVLHVPDSPESNAPDFPTATLLQRCLDIFLARHHDVELCSFFHKPSLDMSHLTTKAPFLLTAIISLATLYISDNEAKEDFGFETSSALSNHYAQLARKHAHALSDEPSVYTVQAYLILAVQELIAWTNMRAWMHVGTAIRMAQVLRLGSEPNQQLSPREKEVRKRTFWACFVVDRLISYSCNQLFTINILSARVQLPCPENAFAFEETYSGPYLENINIHMTQVSQLGVLPFYITMVKLWGDIAILHVSGGRRRLKHVPSDPQGEFYQIDKAIQEFKSNLPTRLHWSHQNYKSHLVTGQAQIFVNLNFLLYHSRCVMHQEYLPQLDLQDGLNLETDGLNIFDAAGLSLDHPDKRVIDPCVRSAEAITDMAVMLHEGQEQDQAILQSTFAANAIMTASAIHLWVLYTQTCDRCPKDVARSRFNRLLQIIKSWQVRWRVAFAWAETLEMLYKLYDFSYGTGSMTEFNLWESGTEKIDGDPGTAREATNENGEASICSEWDGAPEAATISRRLNDKVRSILLNPLLATDVKQQNLRAYCKTLWQYMWSCEPLQNFSSDFMTLEDIMGLNDLPLLGNLDHNQYP
ncbi:fungal-specific transcription factor domain-containing protein [Xylogone sp. PMI_703]|nr:fungal-specific transcription factor domain-containing protein [Xylogone sp. PMI_703]